MSGGSHNYVCYDIEEQLCGKMHDLELDELMKDIAELAHDLEWWDSADHSEEVYRETVLKFKRKWFQSSREQRLKVYVDQTLEKQRSELYSLIGVKVGDSVPAADVAPVVHGKWKATGTFKVADYNYTVVEQRCSACGHCSIRFKNKAESNYCPKCGSKMDEEEHNNV